MTEAGAGRERGLRGVSSQRRRRSSNGDDGLPEKRPGRKSAPEDEKTLTLYSA